jgi:hypothetical protein
MAEKKHIRVELPVAVIRASKAAAAQEGITFKQWWVNAALAQLPTLRLNGATGVPSGRPEEVATAPAAE